MSSSSQYSRVLLKLSGEALQGDLPCGIDPQTLDHFADEVLSVQHTGVQVAVVIGGGNIFRGAALAENGMERVTGDHMGMLATVMNALALQDAIERKGGQARVMSALSVNGVCEDYTRRGAIRHLDKNRVVVFSSGTGNPFFTTDSAASLRAIEIGADLMIKATKVDGVYDSDPMKNPEAKRFDSLSYDTVLENKLNVMDATAVVLCRENNMPMKVLNIFKAGNLEKAIKGESESIGTDVA